VAGKTVPLGKESVFEVWEWRRVEEGLSGHGGEF